MQEIMTKIQTKSLTLQVSTSSWGMTELSQTAQDGRILVSPLYEMESLSI